LLSPLPLEAQVIGDIWEALDYLFMRMDTLTDQSIKNTPLLKYTV